MTDKTLFEPYTLGSLTLANLVVLAPRYRAGGAAHRRGSVERRA